MIDNVNTFDGNTKCMLKNGLAKEHKRSKKLGKVASDKKVLANVVNQMVSRFMIFKREHSAMIKEEIW